MLVRVRDWDEEKERLEPPRSWTGLRARVYYDAAMKT